MRVVKDDQAGIGVDVSFDRFGHPFGSPDWHHTRAMDSLRAARYDEDPERAKFEVAVAQVHATLRSEGGKS